MPVDRLFVDSGFFVARFNPRDQYHETARNLRDRVARAGELWITDAVLLEIGAAFARSSARPFAVVIWDQFHSDPRCRVAAVSGPLLERAMTLFRDRADKDWSLTDCASFVVMSDQGLVEALSCDHHFAQAGFRALLLDAPRPDP